MFFTAQVSLFSDDVFGYLRKPSLSFSKITGAFRILFSNHINLRVLFGCLRKPSDHLKINQLEKTLFTDGLWKLYGSDNGLLMRYYDNEMSAGMKDSKRNLSWQTENRLNKLIETSTFRKCDKEYTLNGKSNQEIPFFKTTCQS